MQQSSCSCLVDDHSSVKQNHNQLRPGSVLSLWRFVNLSGLWPKSLAALSDDVWLSHYNILHLAPKLNLKTMGFTSQPGWWEDRSPRFFPGSSPLSRDLHSSDHFGPAICGALQGEHNITHTYRLLILCQTLVFSNNSIFFLFCAFFAWLSR